MTPPPRNQIRPTTSTPPSATSCAPSRPSRTATTSASASSSAACRPTSSPPTASTASTARSTRPSASSTTWPSSPRAPTSAAPAIRSGAALQHRAAFDGYVRKGEAAHLRDLESKALSVGSDPDGGFLVPDELERAVNRAVKNVSPIRAIAGIRQVSGSVYKKPFAIAGAESGWVAETAARPETDTPTLAELSFPTMELYAMPAATSALLDDSAVNIDEWIAEEVRDAFAQQEGTAFVTGNGTNKPKGFLDYTKVDNATWSWGNIGFIKTGVNGALPPPTRRQADRPRLRGEIRLPRQRHVRLQPRDPGRDPQDEGRRRQLPVAARRQSRRRLHADGLSRSRSEDMPAIATDSYSVAFGDFRRGYLIVDRVGFRWRDPSDWKSCPPENTPAALDEQIGVGNGTAAIFQLAKTYRSPSTPGRAT